MPKSRTVLVLFALTLMLATACQTPMQQAAAPQAPLLVIERIGGIAGFQDRVVIGKNSELYALINHREQIGALVDTAKRQQIKTWSEQFTPFTLTLEDNPNGPDNMVRQLTWNGTGKTAASEVQQQEIMTWCEQIFATLVPNE